MILHSSHSDVEMVKGIKVTEFMSNIELIVKVFCQMAVTAMVEWLLALPRS